MQKVLVSLVVAATLLWGVNAHALSIRLSDGVLNTVTVDDNGAGDLDPLAGVVVFVGGLPGTGFIVNVTTGISDPVLGTPDFPHLDLNSVNVNVGSSGTLLIYLTDTDFTGTFPGLISAIGGTLSAPAGSSLTASVYLNDNNNAFGTDTLLVSHAFGLGAFSATGSGSGVATGPYSLTQLVTLNLTGPGVASFDFEVTAVPEPSSLLLLGSGLVALGLAARRKKT